MGKNRKGINKGKGHKKKRHRDEDGTQRKAHRHKDSGRDREKSPHEEDSMGHKGRKRQGRRDKKLLVSGKKMKPRHGKRRRREKEDDEKSSKRNTNLGAISAMGIFDEGAARGLAVSSFQVGEQAVSGEVDKERIKGAMRWDLWNP